MADYYGRYPSVYVQPKHGRITDPESGGKQECNAKAQAPRCARQAAQAFSKDVDPRQHGSTTSTFAHRYLKICSQSVLRSPPFSSATWSASRPQEGSCPWQKFFFTCLPDRRATCEPFRQPRFAHECSATSASSFTRTAEPGADPEINGLVVLLCVSG